MREYINDDSATAKSEPIDDKLRKQMDLLDRYVLCRLTGASPVMAARYVGVDVAEAYSWSNNAEVSKYVRKGIKDGLENIDLKGLWNVKMAVWTLLNMVNDDGVRDSVRLNAVKELNVLMDITYTDERGNTQRRGLSDFYAETEPKPNAESAENTL